MFTFARIFPHADAMGSELDIAVDLIRRALMLILICSAPILIVGLVVGLVVSLLQAVTQVQEQSLAFIPKIAAMFAAVVVTLPWVGRHLLEFARMSLSVSVTP
jgi:flagellar biosynthetic protein FliQ